MSGVLSGLIYHVASGQAFFSGVAPIALAALPGLRSSVRLVSLGRTVAGSSGLILVAASATPQPAGLAAVLAAATLAWIGLQGSSRPNLQRPIHWLRVFVLAGWGIGLGLELPYHRMPRLAPLGDPPLYVVADSLAAGMGDEPATWPRLLAERHGLDVRDLSRSGATVAAAASGQAPRVTEPGALVLAEIGGNDLLGGTSPEAFGRALDLLLGRLRSEGRTVVLLELPLPPFFNRYGALQRRLARKHGVPLVPKRVLM